VATTINVVSKNAQLTAISLGSAPNPIEGPIVGEKNATGLADSDLTNRLTGSSPMDDRHPDSARAASRSARRAPRTSSKPEPASRRAVAAPIPLLAPVTTATRRPDREESP